MLPEPLQAIAHERLLGVFEHSITWEDDVWKADPLDVPEVHAVARRKFEDLLNTVTQGRSTAQNRILLFHGHSGAGKTHLIRALRSGAHAAHRGYFGYAQMTPDVGNYAEYFLRRLINSLEKPYDPRNPVETGLMRLSNHLVSRAGVLAPGARELLKESAVEGQKLSHLVARLADEIVSAPKFSGQDLDINIIRALLYLQRNDPRIDQRVRQYLYGRPVNEVGQSLVGALEHLEGQDRPFEIIECLGRLMKAVDGAALVFCIDQVEDLRFFDNPEERFQKAIRDLIQIANRVTTAIILISCLDDFYAATREYLAQSFLDRIEKAGPILLSEVRNEDEAREIVLKRMQAAFDEEGLSDQLPAFVEMVETGFMRELAGLSTRRLLEHAQKRWHQLLGEESEEEAVAPAAMAAVTSTPVAAKAAEPEAADPAFAIKTQWDRHIHEFDHRNPVGGIRAHRHPDGGPQDRRRGAARAARHRHHRRQRHRGGRRRRSDGAPDRHRAACHAHVSVQPLEPGRWSQAPARARVVGLDRPCTGADPRLRFSAQRHQERNRPARAPLHQ